MALSAHQRAPLFSMDKSDLRRTFYDYSPHKCPLDERHHYLLVDDSQVPASDDDPQYAAHRARTPPGLLTVKCTSIDMREVKRVEMAKVDRRAEKLERSRRKRGGRKFDPEEDAADVLYSSSSESESDLYTSSSSSSSSSESSSSSDSDSDRPQKRSYWSVLASYPGLIMCCTYDVPADIHAMDQVRFPFKYNAQFELPLRFMYKPRKGRAVELARITIRSPMPRTKIDGQRDLFQHEVRMEHGHYRVMLVTRRVSPLDEHDVLHGVQLEMTTEYAVACLRQNGMQLGNLPALEY